MTDDDITLFDVLSAWPIETVTETVLTMPDVMAGIRSAECRRAGSAVSERKRHAAQANALKASQAAAEKRRKAKQ